MTNFSHWKINTDDHTTTGFTGLPNLRIPVTQSLLIEKADDMGIIPSENKSQCLSGRCLWGKHHSLLCFSLMVCFLLIAAKQPPPVSQNPLLLSVVGDDFILIPIAEYSHGQWTGNWSTPKNFDEKEPPSLKMPGTMFVSTRDGINDKLKLSKLTVIEAHCETNWAYLTNKTTDVPDAGSFRTIRCFSGIALSSGLTVTHEEDLDPSSSESKKLQELILERFQSLEETKMSELARSSGVENGKIKDSGYPINKQSRDSVPLEIKIFPEKHPQMPLRVYRFTAIKKYDHILGETSADCPDTAEFSGWLIQHRGKGASIIETEFVLNYCDGIEGSDIIPLGAFSYDNRLFWIDRRYYYEWEYYEIYEITAEGISRLAEIYGGGC
jgi:hypothetical protein